MCLVSSVNADATLGLNPSSATYWPWVLGKLLDFSVPQFPDL